MWTCFYRKLSKEAAPSTQNKCQVLFVELKLTEISLLPSTPCIFMRMLLNTHLALQRRAGCCAGGPGAPYSPSPTYPRSSYSSSRSPWGWSGSPWWCWPCSLAHWEGHSRGTIVTWAQGMLNLISEAKYRLRGLVRDFHFTSPVKWVT